MDNILGDESDVTPRVTCDIEEPAPTYKDDLALEATSADTEAHDFTYPPSTPSTSSKTTSIPIYQSMNKESTPSTKGKSKMKKPLPEWYIQWLKRDEEKEKRKERRHKEIMKIRKESLDLLKKVINEDANKNN